MLRNDFSSEHIVSYVIIRNITGMQSDRWESLFMEEHNAFNFQVWW
jgi:hypothetical protein